jgi:hypothetical protein
MPIDLSAVTWSFVVLMAVFAFVAALLGSLISFRNRVGGALLAAILFAAMFVAWNYYPHPQIQIPIPTVATFTYPGSPAAAVSAPPSATTNRPPSSPVSPVSPVMPVNPVSPVNPPGGGG